MIRIDPRIGSGEFKTLLTRLGAPCKTKKLRFADFFFTGNGPNGRVRVGIERKTIDEIVAAVDDNRFVGHQLPGLLGDRLDGTRRYDVVYVIVEGSFFPDPRTGVLMRSHGHEVGHGYTRHLYESLEKFQITLEQHGKVRLRWTRGKLHTAYFIAALYRWFQKDWHAHKSAYKVEEDKPERAITTARTAQRKTYAQWPGVGWVKSAMVDQTFHCVTDAVNAIPKDQRHRISDAELIRRISVWRDINWISRKGKRMRLGPGNADRIVRWLCGQEKAKGKGR